MSAITHQFINTYEITNDAISAKFYESTAKKKRKEKKNNSSNDSSCSIKNELIIWSSEQNAAYKRSR